MAKQVRVPDYEASERQKAFHQTVADEKLYGGAAGGGKTAAIVAEAITLALEYPGIPINLFRRTIPELNKTIKAEIMKQCHSYIKAGHMKWRTQAGEDSEGRSYVMTNGSTITLNYLDTDADVYRYQGAEMPVIGVDELTQFPEPWIDYLITRNRTSNEAWPVIFMAGTNPGGVGHGWVKKRFIDAAPAEKVFNVELPDGSIKTRVFIPAKLDDHPSEKFRKDYNRQLQSINDPQLRKALRYGDWDVFAGQVFKEFARDVHVVDPFAIPEHWPRWSSYDHGYNTYLAKLWFTKDPQANRTYIYREMYLSQSPIRETARLIKQYEAGETVRPRLADPAIWKGAGDHNTGDSVAAMFLKEGVEFIPANNNRIAGKNLVHEALDIAPDGLPNLQIFSNCVNIIRTLPSLPYDIHRVEDVDTKAEDHLYDALRYGLMSDRPAKTPKVFVPANIARRKAQNRL